MNSHAIVVSGAASGLGNAVMHRMLAAGKKVAAIDLAQVEAPDGAKGFVCDVTDAGAVNATMDQIAQDFGGIAGVVTCAGIAPSMKLNGRKGMHDPDVFSKVLAVNTVGTFNLMNAGADHMKDNEPDEIGQRGVIITTASVAAFEGQIGQIAYAASKGAVASMTLPAARELARFGIRVMTIAPGVFDTPMLATISEEIRDSIAATIPFPPKIADPADFAALAAHIFDNRALNGEVIRVDGALRMAEK